MGGDDAGGALLRTLATLVGNGHGDITEVSSAIGNRHLLLDDAAPSSSLDEWLAKAGELATKGMGLGVLEATIPEVSHERFLEHATGWVTSLVGVMKNASSAGVRQRAARLVEVALKRMGSLADAPGVKRDGAALVSKVVPATLQLLKEHREGALLDVVAAALHALPGSAKAHAAGIELRAMESLLGGGDAGPAFLAACARCLAAIPMAAAEEGAWSDVARRVLASTHALLDSALLGFEAPGVADVARGLLSLGEQDIPLLWAPDASPTLGTREGLRVAGVLVMCLEEMLLGGFVTPVQVPSSSILLLVSRALAVDPTHPAAGMAATSAMASVTLAGDLPYLQERALDLAQALVRGARQQLVPLGGALADLLADGLRRTGGARSPGEGLPAEHVAVRAGLYRLAATFVGAGGLGAVTVAAAVVLQNALRDLGEAAGFLRKVRTGPGLAQLDGAQGGKKRRKGGAHGSRLDADVVRAQGRILDGKESLRSRAGRLAAYGAALGAVEALLRVGGALLGPQQRGSVDAAVAHVALSSAASLSAAASGGRRVDWAPIEAVHLAALQALVASVVAPGPHRPLHLPSALRLLREGREGGGGAEIAAFCGHAVMVCEAACHQRARPLPPPAASPSEAPPAVEGEVPAWEDALDESAPGAWGHGAGAAEEDEMEEAEGAEEVGGGAGGGWGGVAAEDAGARKRKLAAAPPHANPMPGRSAAPSPAAYAPPAAAIPRSAPVAPPTQRSRAPSSPPPARAAVPPIPSAPAGGGAAPGLAAAALAHGAAAAAAVASQQQGAIADGGGYGSGSDSDEPLPDIVM